MASGDARPKEPGELRWPAPARAPVARWSDKLEISMSQTIIEKIAQTHMAEGPSRPLRAGDFLSIRPHRVMTHDNTSAVMSKFKGIGAKKIQNPQQLVFALDHDIQNQDESNQKKYRAIEAFAKEHGVTFIQRAPGSANRSWWSA